MIKRPEMRQAFVGKTAVVQVEALETGNVGELLKTGVGNVGTAEIERTEVRQLGEAFQAGIGDVRIADRELFECGQLADVNQPQVLHGTRSEIQFLQLTQARQRLD